MKKIPGFALAAALLPGALQAAETPSTGLEEIVVTAQKREESLQQTPLAVTAITAATIRAIWPLRFCACAPIARCMSAWVSAPNA